jgi:hypothetical protein
MEVSMKIQMAEKIRQCHRAVLGMKTFLAVIAGLPTFCPGSIQAAPCQEFTDALNWSEQSTANTTFPVAAYFTKHYGATTATQDAVHYGFGYVVANDPLPILSGTLAVVKNIGQSMHADPALTYYVEIASDPQIAQITYQLRFNGKPVGGFAPTVVKATCLNNVLLTATNGAEVVTVGVALEPSVGGPAPK